MIVDGMLKNIIAIVVMNAVIVVAVEEVMVSCHGDDD